MENFDVIKISSRPSKKAKWLRKINDLDIYLFPPLYKIKIEQTNQNGFDKKYLSKYQKKNKP